MIIPRPARRPAAAAELLPAINLVFLLMIFFTLLGTVGRARLPSTLQPPQAQGAAAASAPAELTLDAAGTLVLQGRAIAPAELESALAAWRQAHPGAALVLGADAAVAGTQAVAVLAIARRAGIARVELLVRRGGA